MYKDIFIDAKELPKRNKEKVQFINYKYVEVFIPSERQKLRTAIVLTHSKLGFKRIHKK